MKIGSASYAKIGYADFEFAKRNAERKVSRSAEREEGCAPPTAPPFEKGGRKLFVTMTVRTLLNLQTVICQTQVTVFLFGFGTKRSF